jgi:DNA polymerase sigma
MFGSCAVGLNLAESDVDLLVYERRVGDREMMGRLCGELVRADVCRRIEAIRSAKVPIIKMEERESGLSVDLSFNRENGVYCVRLVR